MVCDAHAVTLVVVHCAVKRVHVRLHFSILFLCLLVY
jgi:hypothetical protein